MTYEALIITLGFAVDLIALYFLVGIWKDDRAMRIAAEKSLEAQLEYLNLRRSWYSQRLAKKKADAQEQKPSGILDDGNKDAL